MYTFIAIIGLGVFCLVLEIFNLRKAIIPFTIIGLLAILGLTVSDYNAPAAYYNNMIVVNNFSISFSALFIILAILLIAMSHSFYQSQITKISDFISLKVFLLSGAVAMVSFGNLAMFFLGLEVLSIALYVLAASDRRHIKSNEAGMKYFLMGAFASGVLLFGICLIYGAMGTFDLAEISELTMSAELPDRWFFMGLILMVIGMLFKIAAVPFHFWAPDVYEGSPTLTTATMSTLIKVTAMAALYKLVTDMRVPYSEVFQVVIAVVSIASMTIGNIMALRQTNVKRMLAYSGISHAGFMLMTLLGNNDMSGILLYYAAAYALAGVAAFSVLIFVAHNRETETIFNFNGLGKTNPILAAMLTASLLSMAGIPIFAGFFAKFSLFTEVIDAGYLTVVIIAVVNSIISVGYYFKLILAMYTQESTEVRVAKSAIYHAVAIIAIVLNLVMGFFPGLVVDLLP